MADITEVRRTNLRRLVNEYEGMNNLARKLGLVKGAYISQLLLTPPIRTISEKSARKWERKLGLPEGWLDGYRGPATPTSTGGVAPTLDTALLTQALVSVLEALQGAKVTLQPAQVAELVVMQYSDGLVTGRVNPDRMQTIVGMIKR